MTTQIKYFLFKHAHSGQPIKFGYGTWADAQIEANRLQDEQDVYIQIFLLDKLDQSKTFVNLQRSTLRRIADAFSSVISAIIIFAMLFVNTVFRRKY